MRTVKDFLNKHILVAGLMAVALPLLILVALQYQSLAKLQKAMPAAQKMWLKNCLWAIVSDVKEYYFVHAKQSLAVPAYMIEDRRAPEIETHFKANTFPGAKQFFACTFDQNGNTSLLAYDSIQNKTIQSDELSKMPAVSTACSPWKFVSMEGTQFESASLTVYEKDPENRIILNPILNDDSKVVGVVGVVLDMHFLKEEYLPKAIQKFLPRFFPDDTQKNVVVNLRQSCGEILLSTDVTKAREQEDYISLPMPFVFTDLSLGIRDCYLSPEQWAFSYFWTSLTLSGLMTLVLMGGIWFTLRAAEREMKLCEMKTDFVSNVSHELRTPLSSIRVFAEFMKLGRVKDFEKICEYGGYIENESQRLTQLINNILDFSKIESGRKMYRYEKANLADTINDTLKIVDLRLKQSGFDVKVAMPEDPLPPTVIDRDAIAQALLNLLDNAVKYSGEAREIVVRLETEEGHLAVSVTDQGIGIPLDDQEKIFEKFYRVCTGCVHDVKGSGLGLSIVKHIVDAHHGRITVHSKPSQGTTFTIHLPVAES
ncbi:MAG TPA: HAMP domain-containing sensor histidine kinase [Acidobacteriota bacterium]|nr:HAMP domain-containing sensor histidine kinase [Acidobacteriota bacterium]